MRVVKKTRDARLSGRFGISGKCHERWEGAMKNRNARVYRLLSNV
jgi:hypothetical protein